jgi:mannose-6-phosphate isomerase-like protein (cupin superfamily)
MKTMNRREMVGALSAFAIFATLAEAQTADTTPMAESKVFRFDSLPVVKNENGGESRAVMHGTLPTGEFVEVHETMLPPGKEPHPAHKHRNSEFLLIRQGKLEYSNEGKLEPVGVGDVVYSASNRMHGLKNVGDVPAHYFGVSISHGQL